ncbi:19890_t:CDS:2, partial [Racocetra persica]
VYFILSLWNYIQSSEEYTNIKKMSNLISTGQQSIMDEVEIPQFCGICKREASKYTCPRCNLKYCSLNCYKHETHSECTETFYKDKIMDEIKSQRVNEDDKKKMIDMLRRFEQEDYDDITDRFNGLDIDSADIETIWDKLTPQERAEFQQKFIDGKPENFLELIDELPLWKPWWEHSGSDKIVEILPQDRDETQLSEYSQKKFNDNLSQRPQILSDIKRIESVDEAIMASTIITIQNPKYTQPSGFQSLVLGDIVCLLTSMDIVLAALSDLYRLFQSQQAISQTSIATASSNHLQKNLLKSKDKYKKKVFLTGKKFYFYMAYVNSLPQQGTAVLEILRHEVEAEREKCIREGQEYKRDKETIEQIFGNKQHGKGESKIDGKGRLITEI